MKPCIIIIISSLFFCNRSFSQVIQDSLSPEARASALTTSMTCELALFEKQVNTINNINLKAFKKEDEVSKADANNHRRFEKDEDKINLKRDQELKDALTPKQWARYERLSNGDQHLLKVTQVCRKNPDADGGF